MRRAGYFRGRPAHLRRAWQVPDEQQELDQLGRTLAGVLRHFPERFGLDMDEQGFVSIRGFINALKDSNRATTGSDRIIS